tara:strand:+ start:379 stop:549 length:171 start_codon:yes stop_codon:yes gene_type:complete
MPNGGNHFWWQIKGLMLAGLVLFLGIGIFLLLNNFFGPIAAGLWVITCLYLYKKYS